jgi:tRNA threonylcarbamoyladenosine biosynthesis protein TsaE
MKTKLISHSLIETKKIAFKVAEKLKSGDIILFYGDIGAGKTAFIKFIAEYFNIIDVSSPTFNILNIYESSILLYHFDLYRLDDEEELYEIGYEDYFYGDGITVVEWSEKLDFLLPEKYIKIFLKFLDNYKREIIIEYN